MPNVILVVSNANNAKSNKSLLSLNYSIISSFYPFVFVLNEFYVGFVYVPEEIKM